MTNLNEPKHIAARNNAIAFIKSQMANDLPRTYRIPVSNPANPWANQSNRSNIYDIGLALLVFTTSGEYSYCQTIMNRLNNNNFQTSGGGFYFNYEYTSNAWQRLDYVSNDPNSGNKTIMTGAMGWLVWGMCYYRLVTGVSTYDTMINNAGTWLLNRRWQSPDPRAGLLKGGFNSDGIEITWCSTEHQCSALQALQALSILFPNNTNYVTAADNIKSWLNPSSALNLFNNSQNRYNQGYQDDKWALDCSTWATSTAYTLGLITKTKANECRERAKKHSNNTNSFLVQGVGVVKNTNPSNNTNNNFNNGYELAGTVDGFKPYCDNLPHYYHYKDTIPPVPVPVPNDFVWSEGTLGYIHLCMILDEDVEAKYFIDEIIKLQNCSGSIGGIIYHTKTYASVGQNENEPWQGHVWESVCSSAWLYLLINNPKVLFPSLPFCSVSLGTNSLSFSNAASAVANRTSVAFTHPPLQLLNTPASWITGIQLPASSGGQLQFGVSANSGGQRSSEIVVGRDSGCQAVLTVNQSNTVTITGSAQIEVSGGTGNKSGSITLFNTSANLGYIGGGITSENGLRTMLISQNINTGSVVNLRLEGNFSTYSNVYSYDTMDFALGLRVLRNGSNVGLILLSGLITIETDDNADVIYMSGARPTISNTVSFTANAGDVITIEQDGWGYMQFY